MSIPTSHNLRVEITTAGVECDSCGRKMEVPIENVRRSHFCGYCMAAPWEDPLRSA